MINERLKQLDEVTLLELLEIYPEDIVERFQDKIEDKMEELKFQIDWEPEEDE